ncbi:MAG: GrpB family protein [Anaerolineae bacterium]|nr:GrpB family protein [Anaerolineae bacterium]
MIEIVEYNPSWPQEFAAIAAQLRLALGELALHIDHIGSTSVPNLAAKDRIDIQITVADLSAETEARLILALTGLGYVYRAHVQSDHQPPADTHPPSAWHKRLFREGEGLRPTNIHVRIAGNPNQHYPLIFRNYLRTHPKQAAAYAELKRRLAVIAGDDTGLYSDLKDPSCDLIMNAAMESTNYELRITNCEGAQINS